LQLWFVGAIWLYFYRLFMTDTQIGLLDAAAFGVGLLAEIPSGALADRYGRSRIVKIGVIISALGIGLQAFGGFWPILLFQIGVTVGAALISGADEALFFEKLQYKKDSLHWRKFVTRTTQMVHIAGFVAIPIGTLLYQVDNRLPFIINGLALVVAAILIWNIRDTQPKRTKQPLTKSIGEYVGNIKSGFHIISSKTLRIYVPIILALEGLLYAFDWGMLKLVLMDRFHIDVSLGGWVMTGASVLAVLLLYFMHKYAHHLSEKRALTMLCFAVCIVLIMSAYDIRLFGIAVIAVLYICDSALYPFISEAINHNTSSANRSTVISFASFLRALPYVLLAPVIGWLNTRGQLWLFLIFMAVLIMMAWVNYIIHKRRDSFVENF
jgi:MFS family permease